MSRDYKKPDRRAQDKGSPLFAGVLIGLVVGLAVAVGIAVYINFSPAPFVNKSGATAEAKKAPAKESSPAEAPELPADSAAKPDGTGKPRFDFYTILPGSDEPIAEHEQKRDKKPAAAAETYFLQVGAFQAAAEADNMKARLALLGLEAAIQTADVPEKGVWHRVRIGPYSSLEDINRARALLAQNNISASMVKAQGPETP